MRSILRLSLFLTGLVLLIILLGGQLIRRKATADYLVIGGISESNQYNLYQSSPDNAIQRRILITDGANSIQNIALLPDGHSFLYFWRTSDGVEQMRRFSLDTLTSSLISPTTNTNQYALFLSDIPHHNAQSFVLQPQKSALYSLSNDGTNLRRLTPFHRSIHSPQWSPDGEWLFYVAVDDQKLPNAVYRQQFDGSQHTEIIRTNGTIQLGYWLESDSTMLFNIRYSPDETISNLGLYSISTTSDHPSLILSDNRRFLVLQRTTSDWIILQQLNEQSSTSYLLRIRGNGQDYDPHIAIDPMLDTFGALYRLSPTSLMVGVVRGGLMNIYRIDSETGERTIMLADQNFIRINNYHLIADGQAVVFDVGTTDNHTLRYRLDLDTFEFRLLDQFPNSDATIMPTVHHSLALIIGSTEYTFPFQSKIYRLDADTGQVIHLASHDAPDIFPIIYSPPTNGRRTIVSFSRPLPTRENAFQFEVDLVTSEVKPVSFGNDLLFSPFADKPSNPRLILALATSLLTLSLTSSFIKFRRLGR